jgi:parafibromin
MATQSELDDPLYNLRLSITTSNPPILTNTPTPSGPSDAVADLAQATHIAFNKEAHHATFSITTPTRFAPDDKPIDLRSIYFAWLNKDAQVTEYFAAVQRLNEELPSGAGGSVQNLSFAQKIELTSWLSGETDVSENITPLEGAAASAAAGDAAAIAGGKGVPMQKTVMVGGQKMMDARLLQIYDGERRMGDHNTALRGTKPVVRFPLLSTYFRKESNANKLRTSPPTAKSPPHSSAHAPPTPNQLPTPH